MASSPMQMPFMTSNKSKKQISSGSMATMGPGEHGLRCPRCDSANTKFCYYNNYSLTQPRHFCKTCRRYWTKGGALRNVPIGGGCRKSKKSKSSSSASASALLPQQFRLPYVDNYMMLSSGGGGGIASSIESLSSINQDLHWKLQHQRLQAMLYGDQQHAHNIKAAVAAAAAAANQVQVIDDNNNNNNNICFHHTGGDQSTPATRVAAAEETSTDHNNNTTAAAAAAAAAWFLENPYSSMHNNIASSLHNHTAAANDGALSDWSGMQTWSDMHQFAAAQLPPGKGTHGLMS